ncbi:Glyoxalase/Bleomycin resistance protein/Dioxygenase superfamily protein [Sphingobium faniae]|nr:Glyoxalase/Bleomycin resistance protein/Dioxygenase superfamily protein [Sphingobium faniae]
MTTALANKRKSADSLNGPVPSKLAHVVLRSPRFKEMVDWYKFVLAASASYENDGLAFLTYDEEHHRIAVMNMPHLAGRTTGTAGMDHMAFSYDSLADLVAHYRRLKAAGIMPFWAINHGPTTSLYYRDPDENQLEFQVENFETLAESNAFFSSAEFAQNPIGTEYDIEDIGRRLAAGESEADLKRRPSIGPRGLEGIPLR